MMELSVGLQTRRAALRLQYISPSKIFNLTANQGTPSRGYDGRDWSSFTTES